jgi:hypothetical protein
MFGRVASTIGDLGWRVEVTGGEPGFGGNHNRSGWTQAFWFHLIIKALRSAVWVLGNEFTK